MTDYRMVYDSGSKLLKCAIADELGTVIALQSWEKEIIRSSDGFQREWNHKIYWDKLVELTKLTIQQAKIDAKAIKYITASSIRPSCVFADEDHNALYIGASFELKGIDYAEDIDEEFQRETGKTFYQSTGHNPSLLFVPARYKYFQEEAENEGETLSIAQYLPMDSWILMKLGGEAHANILSAAESGFFDLETKMWHPAWKNLLDLPDYFFPWPVLPGEIIGTVSEQWQEELGFDSETYLVAGMPDTQAALLGCQCVEIDSFGAVLGSTSPVQVNTDHVFIDPEEKTWTGLMACKNLFDHYYLEANTGITGQLLKWAANLFYARHAPDLKQRFQKLDEAFQRYDHFEVDASEEQIRESSVYSLLGPAPLASTQMGTTPGLFQFQSPGGVEEIHLDLDAFVAAVFDNIEFAVARNIEVLTEYLHITNPSYAILGGASRNRCLIQRFADLLQRDVTTSQNFESTIQGLLVLCDVAAKKIKSLEDLKQRNQNLSILKIFSPRESMKQKIRTRYQSWLKLYQQYKS